jgi:hypothetical protein
MNPRTNFFTNLLVIFLNINLSRTGFSDLT